MEWIETTGPSVEAAKETAIDLLGVAIDEAEFEVVEVEKTGLLGRVKAPARVRARVLPKTPQRRDDRRNRNRTKSSGSDRPQRKPREERAPKANTRDDAPRGRSERAPRPERDSDKPSTTPQPPAEPVSIEVLAAAGNELLSGLVEAMGVEATITTSTSEERLDFRIQGPSVGVLVGPGGRTVDGLQEITRAVLLKAARGGADVRIGVDVGNYRELRQNALTEFGVEIAQRSVETGTEFVIDPMGSIDRKILHDAVQSVEGAVSGSEGMGDGRRVVVRPG